ncbi:FkbM family methyltransferase [Paenibacillus tengchongensis]|uniref:FkbM family methyltransferase n=1 Tax=Paenibacillus tengchongensis TaxID=2608684 RepID=UPI00124F39C0|nr:FkbM family methyltransferase [Paenibacillus tengchongensis]
MKNNIINLIEKRKIILFISNYMEDHIVKILTGLQAEKVYFFTDCNYVRDMILNDEADKIGDQEYKILICNNAKSENKHIILKLLHQYSRSNIIGLSKKDIKVLYNNYYINYLNERNVDTKSTTIKIGNYTIDNFFMEENCKVQLGDSILPSLFSDLSMPEEGPFEYNSVALQQGDIVFDCGANIGSFSAIALSKGCQIHAFEPIPRTFTTLKENLSHYEPSLYNICNMGLSDKKCTVEFSVPQGRETGSSMVFKNEYDEKINCLVTTIDDYVKENNITKVSFIKADIEGAERFMLLGAANTIRKYSPKLSICTYHLEDDPMVIEEIIRNINSNYIIEHKWLKLYAYIDDDH